MDWLTFITNIIGSLVWPISFVLIFWIFKGRIGELLQSTKRFEDGELEIEFAQQLEERKKEIEERKKDHPIEIKNEIIEASEYFSPTTNISSRAILVDAWVGLEITAANSAKMLGLIPDDRIIPFFNVIQKLLDAGVIQKTDFDVIQKLQKMRNESLHSGSFNISKKKAEEFSNIIRDQAEFIAGGAFRKRSGC